MGGLCLEVYGEKWGCRCVCERVCVEWGCLRVYGELWGCGVYGSVYEWVVYEVVVWMYNVGTWVCECMGGGVGIMGVLGRHISEAVGV